MYVLLILIALAVVFAVILFASVPFGNETQFISMCVSAVLLAIDLLAIVSYVVVTIIFKDYSGLQIIKYTSITAVGIVVAIFIVVASNPLRWSEKHIKEYMLKITPIGTSMEEIVNIIERKKPAYKSQALK